MAVYVRCEQDDLHPAALRPCLCALSRKNTVREGNLRVLSLRLDTEGMCDLVQLKHRFLHLLSRTLPFRAISRTKTGSIGPSLSLNYLTHHVVPSTRHSTVSPPSICVVESVPKFSIRSDSTCRTTRTRFRTSSRNGPARNITANTALLRTSHVRRRFTGVQLHQTRGQSAIDLDQKDSR